MSEPKDTEHRDPEEIREEIRQSTSNLTETLEALQDKLQPEALAAEAKEIVKEKVLGQADDLRSRVMTGVREHPGVAAIVALGGVWLIGRAIIDGPKGSGFVSLALGALIGSVVYRAVVNNAQVRHTAGGIERELSSPVPPTLVALE